MFNVYLLLDHDISQIIGIMVSEPVSRDGLSVSMYDSSILRLGACGRPWPLEEARLRRGHKV